MNLKNYTSSVSVVNSINKIEHRLVSAGATHIAKVYDDEKNVKGITFQIPVNDKSLIFKLPAKSESVFNVLWGGVRRPRPETKENIQQQAARTAWKLLSDWVDIQISLIKIQQVELLEVFLPYCWDPATDKTYFDRLRENKFQSLAQYNK